MRSALTDFNESLNGVEDLANDILANTASALADPRVLRRHELQQAACPVLLTGYFESFLKDAIKAFILRLCSLGRPFNALPERIRHRHYEGGGRVLEHVARATKRSGGRVSRFSTTTPQDVIARLDSARVNSGGGYDILWEAFADTQANPGPDVVSELLKNLDIGSAWPTIAAHASAALKSPVHESTLTSRLDDLIVVRNACAHTGRASPAPDPSKILEYVDALRKTGDGIVGTLEVQIAKY